MTQILLLPLLSQMLVQFSPNKNLGKKSLTLPKMTEVSVKKWQHCCCFLKNVKLMVFQRYFNGILFCPFFVLYVSNQLYIFSNILIKKSPSIINSVGLNLHSKKQQYYHQHILPIFLKRTQQPSLWMYVYSFLLT